MATLTWAWVWGGVATKKHRLATADTARIFKLRIVSPLPVREEQGGSRCVGK
jgi:hypothetical protein